MRKFLIILLFISTSTFICASEIYVDESNFSWENGSKTNPYRTIMGAIDGVVASFHFGNMLTFRLYME